MTPRETNRPVSVSVHSIHALSREHVSPNVTTSNAIGSTAWVLDKPPRQAGHFHCAPTSSFPPVTEPSRIELFTMATMPDKPGGDADDDERLRYAIALSLQDQTELSPPSQPTKPRPTAAKDDPFNLTALDRKTMEAERLARLGAKRRQAVASEDDDVIQVPPPKKQKTQNIGTETRESPNTVNHLPPVPYPDGTVKRTWARGYPRTNEDIKIEEVLQKDQLMLAMLSSFQWDEGWLLSKLDMSRTKLLLAAFAADEQQKGEMRANAPPGVRFCFPPMNGPGSMHSKLQLLKYKDYLRLVVPTGNLVPYDWGESGVMENMVFIIDLPRLDKAANHSPTDFSLQLKHFLQAMEVDNKMIDSLSNFDFSRTARLGFVNSRPGGHTDEAINGAGHCGLAATISRLGLATKGQVQVDMICASLGSIKTELVEAMYNACRGDDGVKSYSARAGRKLSDKRLNPSRELKDCFRIYFPTSKTISDSRGGKGAAGTICLQRKWWHSPGFPRELVRDCVNTRDGLLMHSKVIFVRREDEEAEGSSDGGSNPNTGPAWAYVGSANLSESAWYVVTPVRSREAGMMQASS
ncbi:hypothetical protein JDV02_002714 [Purpureocillium takamizusanense]|uniref:PLD phosphodiesterase domain-containing protein n=1 Tax=Purpureocillium takamizusanense TaxID=2060973 RepID=A0A9Q8V8Z0_9HYPO|nr:uncharacterized protein JDV02_002714 [Purpureocillium takamizusanense]UNI16262.1 hypothetical protein JDV02_002714 [Purpureocillium takamizusanense]